MASRAHVHVIRVPRPKLMKDSQQLFAILIEPTGFFRRVTQAEALAALEPQPGAGALATIRFQDKTCLTWRYGLSLPTNHLARAAAGPIADVDPLLREINGSAVLSNMAGEDLMPLRPAQAHELERYLSGRLEGLMGV